METASHIALHLGSLVITRTVVTTWGIMILMAVASWLIGRRLGPDPGMLQTAAEGVVTAIADTISAVIPDQWRRVFPFVATIWIYIGLANLSSLVPGVHAPTGDLSATAALAVVTFLSVHWFGIRIAGMRKYFRHYLTPSPILLPFHLIGELTRTLALAIRLFGNMMSLEMAAMLVLLVAGLLAPVPILMLHIVEALVQAYIFGMLALVYIAGGIHFTGSDRNHGT